MIFKSLTRYFGRQIYIGVTGIWIGWGGWGGAAGGSGQLQPKSSIYLLVFIAYLQLVNNK